MQEKGARLAHRPSRSAGWPPVASWSSSSRRGGSAERSTGRTGWHGSGQVRRSLTRTLRQPRRAGLPALRAPTAGPRRAVGGSSRRGRRPGTLGRAGAGTPRGRPPCARRRRDQRSGPGTTAPSVRACARCFERLLTVSYEVASTTSKCASSSASKRSALWERPSGGAEQATATNRACRVPSGCRSQTRVLVPQRCGEFRCGALTADAQHGARVDVQRPGDVGIGPVRAAVALVGPEQDAGPDAGPRKAGAL